MKPADYQIISKKMPLKQRGGINESIIESIHSGNNAFTKEDIFNQYTGRGGLHNLNRKDYANYSELSKAKREIEMGQFFTPHETCRHIMDLVNPGASELVIDMCCGMCNFFNFLPDKNNAFGFDIDDDALLVAKHLYPDADIKKCDIRNYSPEYLFDYVIGNPPFNLDFDGTLSQFFYIDKAYPYWSIRFFISLR